MAIALSSSLRTRTAEETCDHASRLMGRLGISRVTDITRLDKLGLPVHASVRPRGQALRVHAGKGLRTAESRAGALMEALEFSAADPRRNPAGRPMTAGDLQASWNGAFRFIDLAPRRDAPVQSDTEMPVLDCEDLANGSTAALPTELLFVSDLQPAAPPAFGSNTNGVTSGNTLDEATLHGILEVLERDALSFEQARHASRRVEDASLPAPFLDMALQWRRRGVQLVVREVPNAAGLPCFTAHLVERDSPDVNLCAGTGLHLHRDIALARAVCEAAQSRLTTLHGGRDDIVGFYSKYQLPDPAQRRRDEESLVTALQDDSHAIRFADAPDMRTEGRSLPETLASLLAHLRQLGLGSVLRYRFHCELDGLHALRIVIPRTECATVDSHRMGPRLLAALAP